MVRKTKEQKRKNQKELYDSFINRLFPETLKGLEEGTICGEEIVDLEDLERFGCLFDPKYRQLRERHSPVRDGAMQLHWIERNMFFNLGAAFGRRRTNTLNGK